MPAERVCAPFLEQNVVSARKASVRALSRKGAHTETTFQPPCQSTALATVVVLLPWRGLRRRCNPSEQELIENKREHTHRTTSRLGPVPPHSLVRAFYIGLIAMCLKCTESSLLYTCSTVVNACAFSLKLRRAIWRKYVLLQRKNVVRS